MLQSTLKAMADPSDSPGQPGDSRGARPAAGRNDPCPCGSGRKYKKCCSGKAAEAAPQPLSPPLCRAREALDGDLLEDILIETLDRGQLLGIVHQTGLHYPGVRESQFDAGDLAGMLAQRFFDDAAVTRAVTESLDRAAGAPKDLLPAPTSRQMRALDARQLHALAWRLACTDAPEARAAFRRLLEAREKLNERMDRRISGDIMRAVVEDLERAKEELISTRESAREAKASALHQERRGDALERAGAGLRKDLEAARRELAAARADAGAAAAAAEPRGRWQALTAEAEGLRRDLAAAAAELREERAEGERLRAKLDQARALKRVGLFVDVQNLIGAARELHQSRPDFAALWRKVEGGAGEARVIAQAYAYLAEDLMQEKTAFKGFLESKGYTVRSRPVIYRADGTAKANWDIGMALETLERAERLDIVVLATGDGDFTDLIKHLKEKRPDLPVEVAAFESPRVTSEILLKAADRVHVLGSKEVLPPRPGGSPASQAAAAAAPD